MGLQGKNRPPAHAGATLKRVLQELGVERIMRRHAIWSDWGQVVGDQVRAHTHPEFLSGRCLFVTVDQPTWLHHLGFLKDQILANIHRRLGSDEISEIRFRLGTLPPVQEERTGPAVPCTAEPSAALLKEVETCLSKSLSPPLETVLRRVLTKDLARKTSGPHRGTHPRPDTAEPPSDY